jgi:hypothetical protein
LKYLRSTTITEIAKPYQSRFDHQFSSKDIIYPPGITNPDIDTSIRSPRYTLSFVVGMRNLANLMPKGFVNVPVIELAAEVAAQRELNAKNR